MPELDVAGRTDRGRERARNEDQFAIADLYRQVTVRESSMAPAAHRPWAGGAQGLLLAVADGIGGHAGGDIASAAAVDALLQYATWQMPWVTDTARDERLLMEDLGAALEVCQDRVRRVARREHLEHQEPGTTLTAAYISWPSMFIVHAGDTRCYLLRDGKLLQLTTDHTLAAQLVGTSVMSAEAAENSRWSHVLNNAIGGGPRDVKAEVRRAELRRGDVVLLCSDGLTRHLDEPALARTLSRAATAERACGDLIAAANGAGGRDNITAVVIRVPS
ncbi:MAG TPA: protein phosphatase 2C domain-containing protein [Kofleriaceae bacterium]|nr:protein phosphatase 2C domain-containing protein [Kofleriaceae bacterium]